MMLKVLLVLYFAVELTLCMPFQAGQGPFHQTHHFGQGAGGVRPQEVGHGFHRPDWHQPSVAHPGLPPKHPLEQAHHNLRRRSVENFHGPHNGEFSHHRLLNEGRQGQNFVLHHNVAKRSLPIDQNPRPQLFANRRLTFGSRFAHPMVTPNSSPFRSQVHPTGPRPSRSNAQTAPNQTLLRHQLIEAQKAAMAHGKPKQEASKGSESKRPVS